MNALANEEVGKYLNDHFVSSFQKVGTFRVANGEKQGGNVASYFTLADGSVLHVVAGPVDAATLLREARWVIETRKLAVVESKGSADKYKAFFRKAHAERLRQEHGVRRLSEKGARPASAERSLDLPRQGRGLNPQGRVHLLLASYPLVKIDDAYQVVFEKILGEQVSTLPVVEERTGP